MPFIRRRIITSATRVAVAAWVAVLLSAATARATLEIYDKSNQVDGVYNNSRVIVRAETLARKPIFSWGLAGSEIVTSFVVRVATSPLEGGTTIFLWSVADSTSPSNMTRLARYDLIKISYAGETLETATTYYWGVQAYGDRGSTATALGYFHTIAAAQTPSAPTMDIRIDYNNPLKPGRVARLVAAAFDRDRTVKLRVFSMTGELVMDWPEFIVPKNAYYVVEWNGNDINGSRLKRGIYIVNLYDENDKSRVNRRMAILER